jgi:hypothetical protein
MQQVEPFKVKKVQKTYKGQTADSLLERARVEKMRAGRYAIIAFIPDGEQFVVRVHKDEKKIYLCDNIGCKAVLECSAEAYDGFCSLSDDCWYRAYMSI